MVIVVTTGVTYYMLSLSTIEPVNMDKEIEKLKEEYIKELEYYEYVNDSLDSLLIKTNAKIDLLYIANHKLIDNYETQLKSFDNPIIVSDDSISRYIANRIHNTK